ncbi:FAD binding domain-containing protein [Paenibacillus qinlingensis]|uniref:CO/xanthine dehydrogenase FAD-binding subunit n=1 Tax=Paenibacillus qinlingensis TaxID=1837343 RepID=A0ABU1NT84_9BACL|nr:FAD binding domain-containing protein [Paenibacillus qinlingensis]MDR6550692.1 CO/xanthine dehydrogenase FAD-binding subunit [Paenibacillus qinlingensis]
MISFDFEYELPSTVEEAIQAFQRADSLGLDPIYYSGGTEIITRARLNQLRTGAVIDVKGIPESNVLLHKEGQWIVGAARTLTELAGDNSFPLLTETVHHLADQTNRNKITIGGHLCGTLFYREALLPFLLTDSEVVLASPNGARQASIHSVFNGGLRLERGEMLIQIITDRKYLDQPTFTVKRTKIAYIDYPIVRICAMNTGGWMRFAFSGVSAVPFRSQQIDERLNDASLSPEMRIDQIIRNWPFPVLNDILASADYRRFVLRNSLSDSLAALERRGG